jgi:hypothetical protein
MASFDDREKGYEAKFAHDAQLRFKAEARRNRLLGLWAAEKLGITDETEAKNYATEVVSADFEEAGDEDVFRKVSGDFAAKNIGVGEQEIRTKMSELMALAQQQVLKES